MPQFESGEDHFEWVRRANPVDEVINERARLLPHIGSQLKGACPFHADRFLSLHVAPGTRGGRYHCFGCGADGDVVEFVMAIDGLTRSEAVTRLAARARQRLRPSANDDY